MRHRSNHYDTMASDVEQEHCPLCHAEPHGAHVPEGEAVLKRLEHLEHMTRAVLVPTQQARRAEEGRAVTTPALRAVELAPTLWQGRPALAASALSVLSAAAWAGLWGLALLQYQTIVATLALWQPRVHAWLLQSGAVELAWWEDQAVLWLTTPGASGTAMGGVLLGLALSAGMLMLTRLRRAVRTSYCLTTQHLSTQQGGQWLDVALAELDRVTIRRPFWGRRLGYVHLRFIGHRPVTRRVQWWGVPQRALLLALLQGTLQGARPWGTP